MKRLIEFLIKHFAKDSHLHKNPKKTWTQKYFKEKPKKEEV